MRKFFLGIAIAVGAVGVSQAAVLDFESLNAGDIVTSFTEGPGGTVSATGGSGDAMVFDSDNPTGGDNDLGASFPGLAVDPGNILIISEDGDQSDPDDNAGGGTLTFVFNAVIDFLDLTMLDIDQGETLTLTFFDDMAMQIDQIVIDGSAVGNGAGTLLSDQVSAAVIAGLTGVKTFTAAFSGSGALDSLIFADVPLPATLPMLLTGLVGLGFASRRRRKI